MTTIPAGWWLVGSGALPVAQTLPPFPFGVVLLVVAFAAALALRAAWRAGQGKA
jgi:hypothetical protein